MMHECSRGNICHGDYFDDDDELAEDDDDEDEDGHDVLMMK